MYAMRVMFLVLLVAVVLGVSGICTADVIPVDGIYSGTSDQGLPWSITVGNDGHNVLKFEFTLHYTCTLCNYTATTTIEFLTSPPEITDGSFLWSGDWIISGTFTSSTSVSGTWEYPYDSHCYTCNDSGTWAATLSAEDSYEENDTRSTAWYHGRPGSYDKWERTWFSEIDGLGVQRDDDWYKIWASKGTKRIAVDCRFTHANGDINIALFDAQGNRYGGSWSTTDNEYINCAVPTGEKFYYIRVYKSNLGNTYDLRWADLDDSYEENNTRSTAWYPGTNWERTWLSEIDGLASQYDDDWYKIWASKGTERIVVDCRFTHANGDINIALFDGQGNRYAGSWSTTDNEFINCAVPTDEKFYYIRVYKSNSGNTYDLRWADLGHDDGYEQNDTRSTAWYPGTNWERTWLWEIDGPGVQRDDDWYKIWASKGTERILVDCWFNHADGDINIALFDAQGNRYGGSWSTTDSEHINCAVPTGEKFYYIRVYKSNVGNIYDLWWGDVAGSSKYKHNGDPAEMSYSGPTPPTELPVVCAPVTTYEEVLPATSYADSIRVAGMDSVLAIRLRSDEEIDSVWGTVVCSDFETDAVEWLAVEEGHLHDGWVVYRPEAAWLPGDLVTMTVGASTASGAAIEPITYQFEVETEDEYLARIDRLAGAMWQPLYSDYDATGLDLTAEANDTILVTDVGEMASIPVLPIGVGLTYEFRPDRVFDMPQRVWLPVPAGTDANEMSLYYYHATGADSGWYPAENVGGWLVPDSDLQLDLNGTTYLGFVVRHSGVVQLGIPEETADKN